MASLSDKTFNELNKQFEIDQDTVFEFGWCNVADAVDRETGHDVRLYLPRDDVWAQSAQRKLITAQFKSYHSASDQECLPQSIDLIAADKRGLECAALVTRRDTATQMFQGDGSDWSQHNDIPYAERLAAIHRLGFALKTLHEMGIVHGSIGARSVGWSRVAGTTHLRIEMLNFGSFDAPDVTTAPIFEPAFIAPELVVAADDPVVRSERTDVYSFGRLALLFLLGTRKFVEVFAGESGLEDEETSAVLSMLGDPSLWRNVAARGAPIEPDVLETASDNRMSYELSEFLSYASSNDPAVRPADGPTLYHGLTTSMGAGARSVLEEMPEAKPSAVASSGLMQKLFPAAAVVFLIVCLGVGWKLFSDKRAFQAEVDTALASCKALQEFMNANEDVTLLDTAAWGRADAAFAQVSAERASTDPGGTKSDCDAGLLHAQDAPMERRLALDLALVETSAAAAEAEGIDLEPIKVSGKAEDISDDILAANFEIAKEAIVDLGGEVTQQRSLFHQGQADHVVADITALNGILELSGDQALSVDPVVNAKNALMDEFTDENVALLTEVVAESTSLVAGRISGAAQPVVDALKARFADLEAVDAARAEPAFAGLKLQVEDATSTLPVDVETLTVFSARTGTVNAAIGAFATELSAKLIAAVDSKLVAARAEGLGNFLPSFDEAEQAFAALSSGHVELAAIAPVGDTVETSLAAARSEMTQALEDNMTLRTKLAVVMSTVSERGLEAFEPYKDVIGGFEDIDALDLVSQNSALNGQIASVQNFLDRFDAGAFLNCNIVDGFALAAVSSTGFKPEASDILKKQEIVSGSTPKPLPSMYCLSMKHITLEDLYVYKDALGPRDQPILDEIERARADEAGRAVNISFWLASRYAQWVGIEADAPVCLPPADAVLNATRLDAADDVKSGELFVDSCGGSDVLKRNIVLRMGEDRITASCVSSSAVVEDMGFRLAAGALCEE